MKDRALAIVLLLIGSALALLGLGADAFGIGEGTGIGWKQISAAIAGGAVALFGAIKLRRR